MNLSISVFKSAESRVLVALAVSLFLFEIVLRIVGDDLSNDVAHLNRVPVISESMARASKPRVLLIGNSILLAGIAPDRLREGIRLGGDGNPAPAIYMVHPDSSHVTIWDYLLHRYFLEEESLPEDLVIVTGRTHLRDAPVKAVELGGYYVSDADIPRYFHHDNRGFDEAVSFFNGRFFATARLRKRVSPRIFDAVLPYYQENWSLLHQVVGVEEGAESAIPIETEKDTSEDSGSSPSTYHLQSLARSLNAEGIRTTVVLAPAVGGYQLDPRLEGIIREAGWNLLDFNRIPGLGMEQFQDEDHLNEEGRAIFTEALATQLAKSWIPKETVR